VNLNAGLERIGQVADSDRENGAVYHKGGPLEASLGDKAVMGVVVEDPEVVAGEENELLAPPEVDTVDDQPVEVDTDTAPEHITGLDDSTSPETTVPALNAKSQQERENRRNKELFQRIAQGDDHARQLAREELAARHDALARGCALRYAKSSEPLEDLIQVARLGLLKAIDRYDADREVAFSSYAYPTILGEIKRYFRDKSWGIHVSRGMQERASRVFATKDAIEQETGKSCTAQEVSKALQDQGEDITLQDVNEVWLLKLSKAYQPDSLDAPIVEDDAEADRLVDAVIGKSLDGDSDTVIRDVGLEAAMDILPERDRRIIELRFFEDMTQAEIAEQVGVSQMHISRLLRRSLEQMGIMLGAS
jgi:RNA polymerase sigma-B factor